MSSLLVVNEFWSTHSYHKGALFFTGHDSVNLPICILLIAKFNANLPNTFALLPYAKVLSSENLFSFKYIYGTINFTFGTKERRCLFFVMT